MGHKRGVWKVVFSPIDKVLVSCSGDRTMKLWSVTDYSQLRTFDGHTASVLSAKFVNKGTQLVSSSADGLIRLWTLRTGECESTMDMHADRVWALEYLPVDSTETIDGSEVQSRHSTNM
jgi:U3 small nucleolar RNA-associated protein 13